MLVDSLIVPECIYRPGSFTGLMTLYESNYIKLSQLTTAFEWSGWSMVSTSARDKDLHAQLVRREPYTTTLARAWTAISGQEGEPYLRIFSRLHDTAGEPLWPGFRRTATTDWLAPLQEGMRSLGRPELATVVLAVIRGLLMDLDATGDSARTDRAFGDFLATL